MSLLECVSPGIIGRGLDEPGVTRVADIRDCLEGWGRIIGAHVREHVAGIVVIRAVLQQQVDAQGIAGLEQYLPPYPSVVQCIAILVAGNGIFHPTVVLMLQDGNSSRRSVAQRSAKRPFKLDPVVFAVREIRITFCFTGRFRRHVVDQAACRISAIQRALRTAQDLDAFKVEYLLIETDQVSLVEFVNVDR